MTSATLHSASRDGSMAAIITLAGVAKDSINWGEHSLGNIREVMLESIFHVVLNLNIHLKLGVRDWGGYRTKETVESLSSSWEQLVSN